MTNFQCKKLDPLVTGDIGSFCVECLQDTNFLDAEGNQTFRFVNRISADRDVYNEEGKVIGQRFGWLCAECNFTECDRCDEKIYCDEDFTPYDVYRPDEVHSSVEVAEFSDGAYRVHYECLTDKEKQIMEANNQ